MRRKKFWLKYAIGCVLPILFIGCTVDVGGIVVINKIIVEIDSDICNFIPEDSGYSCEFEIDADIMKDGSIDLDSGILETL